MVQIKLFALIFCLTLVSFGTCYPSEKIDAVFNGTSDVAKPIATNSDNGKCTCMPYYKCNTTVPTTEESLIDLQ